VSTFDLPELDWPFEDPLDPKQVQIQLSAELSHFQVDGSVAVTNLAGSDRRACRRGQTISMFGGTGVTGSDGHWEVDLAKLHCLEGSWLFDLPSITATGFGGPSFLTASYRRLDFGRHLVIVVDSYLHDASKAPLTPFSWHCLVAVRYDQI
jgi:hypothetical protein